jgi:hypothetical protein
MATIAVAVTLMFTAKAAAAEYRWQEAALGAVAILPPPTESSGIIGGSLACAEQRWSFLLRVDPSAAQARRGEPARLTIDNDDFPAKARRTKSGIMISVPPEAIDALKAGSWVSILAGGGSEPAMATFSLGRSRKVLDAVAPRCSRVDMSGFDRVVFSKTSPVVEAARSLLAGEIKLFQSATGKSPTIAAAVLNLEAGRKLLFAKLCGSTSYYGESGCSLTGYAAAHAPAEWKQVYNTDGLLLHIDPKSAADGWPDLLTLPVAGDAEASRWRWSGSDYAIPDVIVTDEESGAVEARPAR